MRAVFYDPKYDETRMVFGSWQCLKQSALACLVEAGNGLIEGLRKTAISGFLCVPTIRKRAKYVLDKINEEGY